jgi:orotate phosphoribosyltransferase
MVRKRDAPDPRVIHAWKCGIEERPVFGQLEQPVSSEERLLRRVDARELDVRFYFAAGPNGVSDGLFKATYSLTAALAARVRGERVAVVDDVISAGSSVRATKLALDNAGARTLVVGTFLTLGDTGRSYFESHGTPLEALDHREFTMWKPSECPLCAAGASLVSP